MTLETMKWCMEQYDDLETMKWCMEQYDES